MSRLERRRLLVFESILDGNRKGQWHLWESEKVNGRQDQRQCFVLYTVQPMQLFNGIKMLLGIKRCKQTMQSI